MIQLKKIVILSLTLLLTLAACGPSQPAPTATLSGVVPTDTAAPPPAATETPPPPQARVILLTGAGSEALQASLQPLVEAAAADAGLLFEVWPQIGVDNLMPDVRLVVALPPVSNLAELAAAAPNTQFVAVGMDGLESGPNLSVLAPSRDVSAQQGFLAGYIAALVTEDWRVGVLSAGGNVTWQSFVNGTRYFCGLCRQEFPPFYEYPLVVDLSDGASAEEWLAGADYLIERATETVFVGPGGEAAALYLMAAGVQVIGAEARPSGANDLWLVTLQPDYAAGLQAVLPGALGGAAAGRPALPLLLTDVNNAVLPEGKHNHLNEIINQLSVGLIAPLEE